LGKKLANVLQPGYGAVGDRHARGAAVLEQLDKVQLEGQLQLLGRGDAARVSRLLVVVRPRRPKNIRPKDQSCVGNRPARRQGQKRGLHSHEADHDYWQNPIQQFLPDRQELQRQIHLCMRGICVNPL
jgi:hypothetical protein